MHNSRMDQNIKIVHVGFLYPVIKGKLYVGKRGTEPHQGLYGPVGGKSGVFNPNDKPYTKSFPARPHTAHADFFAKLNNVEYGHASAIREFYEEAYQLSAIEEEVTDIFRIGAINDEYNGAYTNCQFYMAQVTRSIFNLSKRELHDLCPIETVNPQDLFPLAKLSLFALKYVLSKGIIERLKPYAPFHIENQIPDLEIKEIQQLLSNKMTTMEGLHEVVVPV